MLSTDEGESVMPAVSMEDIDMDVCPIDDEPSVLAAKAPAQWFTKVRHSL
jgi:hypothetical protein